MNSPKQKTVLLGLSGGVDSAVAALLLKQQGYNVKAVFIKSFSETKNKLTARCSWRDDYREAQTIAALLNLPLILLDLERDYRKKVLDPMFRAYQQGITPNPDITCNTLIKFPLLWKAARKIKADYIATGHHARIKKTARGFELHQGKDKNKDQSYFLYELSQYDLAHTLLPVGNLTKAQVRTIAEKNKFPNCNRQSSRGVCFVGNIPLKTLLEQRLKPKQGRVLNEKGDVIGTHRGTHYYTLGERVRPTIGIAITKGEHSQERFFIVRKDRRKNTLTVVPDHHPLLSKKTFPLKNLHWINIKEKTATLRAKVRIRHLGQLIPATLTVQKNIPYFTIAKPLEGVAPGQSAVFYQGSKCICGGEIAA